MTMVTRQIVGYDPQTERVAFEFYIPPERWIDVIHLVDRNAQDPQYIYSYPLEISLANDIMGLMGHRLAPHLNYFLECEAAD